MWQIGWTMTRRRLRRTAMPQSWRPVTEHKVEQFGDVVITTEVVNPSKGSRYYNIYTYGQLFGTAHSLADAKYQVEVIYGPLNWHRQPNPPVEVIHYYFGRTTEFTEPTTIYTADLPMLGYAASRRVAYQMTHRPIQDGAPLHDLTQMFPPDVYTHPHYYSFGGDEMGERKTHAIVREYQGQPDKPVTIYRAVPEGVTSINTGDWVTITREYAVVHSLHPTDPEQDLPIISATVPAHTLLNGGNDLLEWGYWGPSITARTGSKRHASSNTIYRGFQVALPSHIEEEVRRLAEPPLEEWEIDQSKGIGKILIDWLQGSHWESGVGLGRHWTRRHEMAEAAAMRGGAPGGWGIILTATYSPADENPDLTNTTQSLAESEAEVNLRPGAPVTITNVEILGWRMPLIDQPIRATAKETVSSVTKQARSLSDYGAFLEAYMPTLSPDTQEAASLISDALIAVSVGDTDAALMAATRMKRFLSRHQQDASEWDNAIQRFLLRYADIIIKTVGDYPVSNAPNYLLNELDAAWHALQPHLRLAARNASRKTASKTYYRGISLYPYPEGLRQAIDDRDISRTRQLILDALDPDEVGVWWTPNFAEAERFGSVVLVGQTGAQLEPSFARFPAGTIITLTDILVNMPDELRPLMAIPDGYSWQSVLDRPMQVRATRNTGN